MPESDSTPYTAEMPPFAPPEEQAEEHALMLDVHPAHHAANSWKEFLVHIATIVLGLLIAVGLEQTVEYIHHRREVTEARRALTVERQLNINAFVAEAEEFHRFVPILKTDLAILVYLREHPHAPAAQWPGTFGLHNVIFNFTDSAWKNAVDNHVIAYMPAAEVARNNELYARLHALRDEQVSARDTIGDWQRLRMYAPDPATWSREEIDYQIELTTQMLKQYHSQAIGQSNLARFFRDFHDPLTSADTNSIVSFIEGASLDPKMREIEDRMQRANAEVRAAAGEAAEDSPQ